jgi:hypothetical protein
MDLYAPTRGRPAASFRLSVIVFQGSLAREELNVRHVQTCRRWLGLLCLVLWPVIVVAQGDPVVLLRQVAEAGDARAMSELGDRYRQGRGVVRDDAEAIRWFQKGAAAGEPSAITRLGEMYLYGEGVARDDTQALHWFQKGAEAGDGWAMRQLGIAYREGRGAG